MKKLLQLKFRRSAAAAARLQWDGRTGEAVERWVQSRGYLKPLATVAEIADDIGVPADRLTVWVRIHTGSTLLGWRKGLRIEVAKRILLEYPDLPVSTVGLMVGIDDKSNFKRQFTELVRQTPRQWRERHGV